MTEITLRVKVWHDKKQKRFLIKLPKELEPILQDKDEIIIKIVTDT